ncbi:MAG: ATP-binding protein [Mycobacterium sp.]|nr:ATP-binding protein [Mycobacterium sp.]
MNDRAPGPGPLGDVETTLEAFWSLHEEVPSRVRMEIGIAAAEIAANILEHGHAARFDMELRVLPDAVQVEFTDNGDPADVDLDCVCMPDEMAERGRGLAIAQAALRLVSYCRDELGNHWRLVSKAFPSSPHRA